MGDTYVENDTAIFSYRKCRALTSRSGEGPMQNPRVIRRVYVAPNLESRTPNQTVWTNPPMPGTQRPRSMVLLDTGLNETKSVVQVSSAVRGHFAMCV
ncbi:hypothetical protein DPEC_G00172850 [Dallia pectoralis]|uniref:Uncharacterized protein n=1 Tax=Dallia pectoralis TaxID=75939 RepID=A0ACC2GDZ2_DALPE|nr:hypothetical protein DPEC_G00172850 [Dallia pectoralis]